MKSGRFDTQSPLVYPISTCRRLAQMCGYGAGEAGAKPRSGGNRLCRWGGREGGKPFVAGCRGGSALLGSRGKAPWRVNGGSHYRVKGEAPCPVRSDALRHAVLGIT